MNSIHVDSTKMLCEKNHMKRLMPFLALLVLAGCPKTATPPPFDTTVAIAVASAYGSCGFLPGSVLDEKSGNQALTSLDLARAMVDYLRNDPRGTYQKLVDSIASLNPAVAPYATVVATVMVVAADQLSIQTYAQALELSRAVIDACKAGILASMAGGDV